MVSTLRAKSQSFRQSPMPSTYAITGSNGFIAAHLIQDLTAQGHTVLGIVRDAKAYSEQVGALGAKVVEVPSLDDSAALVKALAGVDGLFHMAAVHPKYGFEAGNREAILKTAVSGTLTVLEAAKAAGVRRSSSPLRSRPSSAATTRARSPRRCGPSRRCTTQRRTSRRSGRRTTHTSRARWSRRRPRWTL